MVTQLTIHEIYESLQGESSYTGWPFVFVRLTGCSLRCAWCDTAHAFYGGRKMSIASILEAVAGFAARRVCITGGEPMDQTACRELIQAFLEQSYLVLVETAGHRSLSGWPREAHYIVDVKLPASGMQSRNHPDILAEVTDRDEVKFVIGSREDYQVARDLVQRLRLAEKCTVLFSTVFAALPERDVAAWILEDRLPVRFQLQLHKYVWSPEARGV